MHFNKEIIEARELHVPAASKVGKKEFEMARHLVESMSGAWKPEKYKDDYKDALMEVIEEKVAAGGKDVAKPRKADRSKATNVIDLVSVLQQSIDKHGKRRTPKATKPKPKRKAA